MRSAFAGHIDEIPFIMVDNFENDLSKKAYFLSHYHGDHVVGLNGNLLSPKLKKNNAFIYASKVTIAIIKQECPKLAPYLKVLNLGSNTISIKTDDEEIFLNVKVLPAGHSLGSVMFLFEYNKKNILYTGDFRISRNSVAKYSHFHSQGEPIPIDVIYVDTTFQNVPSFPKRSEVVRNVVFHIKNWLNRSEKHQVVLLTSAGYGYEYVCNKIYNEIKLKTYVADFYWHIYSQFPKEIYGMTNDPASKVRLSTRYKYHKEPKEFLLEVYFSALKWGDKSNTEEDFLTVKDNRIEVCFSTHNGRDELIYFIDYFKPSKIVGFPDEFDPSNIDVLRDGFPVPEPLDENFRISPKRRRVVVERDMTVGKRVSRNILEEALNW